MASLLFVESECLKIISRSGIKVVMSKHTVSSEIVEICAPIDIVWKVLVDIEKYGEWNPFTYRVETSLKVGDPVDLYVRMPKGGDQIQRELVQIVDKPHTLAWGMKMGFEFILKAQRQQKIEIIDEQRCRFRTWDSFSGFMTPVVIRKFGDDMENGFNAMALALKERAESIVNQPDH